jgi:hypothetical protein
MSRETTTLGLSGHHQRDQAAAEDGNGNGRTGLFVKLTVKQVSIVLGIAAALATSVGAWWTREPKPEAHATAAAVANHPGADPRLQDLVDELRAMGRELADVKDDGRYTRGQVLGLREDVRDLKQAVRSMEERARTRAERDVVNGGGSK